MSDVKVTDVIDEDGQTLREKLAEKGEHVDALATEVADLQAKLDALPYADASLFIAKDGYGDPTLWREEPDHSQGCVPILSRYQNGIVWDLFVEGRFPVREDEDAEA